RTQEWPCYRCRGAHAQNTCCFKNISCNFCKRLGHIDRVCRAKSHSTVNNGAAKPMLSTQCKWTQEHLWSLSLSIHSNDDFKGCVVEILSATSLQVKYSSFNGSLPVVVVNGPRRSLLGKNWFKPLGIRLVGVHSVALTSVQDLIEEYAELFSDTLGTVKRPPVVLHTDGSIPPIQMNAMRVPFALKGRISEELDRLPVQYTAWTTLIVPVIKSDRSIQICGDYKCTEDKALRKDLYQI
ncbi:hypothetical protein T09_7384, partial [Trichinella sp. T9]